MSVKIKKDGGEVKKERSSIVDCKCIIHSEMHPFPQSAGRNHFLPAVSCFALNANESLWQFTFPLASCVQPLATIKLPLLAKTTGVLPIPC